MNFTITDRVITCDTTAIVGDNSDYLAMFTFSSEWDEKIKTARFMRGNVYVDVLLDNDTCKIPAEVLKAGFLYVGVFSPEMTTTICTLNVQASIKDKHGKPVEPTPDIYSQITEMLEDLQANGVTDAQIEKAIKEYLEENPITGVDEEEVQKIVSEYIEANKDSLKGADGKDGAPGEKGEPGTDGKDGVDGKSAYEIAIEHGFEGSEEEWLASLKGKDGDSADSGSGEDVTTKILIDTLYTRNLKNNFAFMDMPTAQCALILDDCLPSVITTCVDNAKAKNVPLNMSAISEHFGTLTKQGTETVLEAIKRGISNSGEVLLHGDGTINESNINDENYLKQKFLDEKEAFIANGLNPRGVIVIGGDNEIYGDIRTDRWVRALFDYSDGYGTSEPYYHRRYAPTTLEQAKVYIDDAVANKSFCPIFAHKWYDFWDEMIDYAISKGAVWTTYANVYDTYGTTMSVKALENRLKALESNSDTITKILESIDATKSKTTYTENDVLETDDITVIATYSDGSTTNVTADANIDTSRVVMNQSGSYTIDISYGDKKAYITIVVEVSAPSEPSTGTVIYEVASLNGTCNGTKDEKVGDSSTAWTSGKQYRYIFDYEVTAVQDEETTVDIRGVNSDVFGENNDCIIENATVGQSGHIDFVISNSITRNRQAFLLKNHDKTYSVKLTNVVITEL